VSTLQGGIDVVTLSIDAGSRWGARSAAKGTFFSANCTQWWCSARASVLLERVWSSLFVGPPATTAATGMFTSSAS